MDEFEASIMAVCALILFGEDEAADKIIEMFAEKVTK